MSSRGPGRGRTLCVLMTSLVFLAAACSAGEPSPSKPQPQDPSHSTPPVYAHYMLQFPLSLDNLPVGKDYYATQWLTVDGESGKHRGSAGYLRDRPLTSAPQEGDYLTKNYQKEIEQARNAGIDGFMVDLQNPSGPEWERLQILVRAADQTDFRIIPTVDALAQFSQLPASGVASRLEPLYRHRSVVPESGDVVLSSFAAESKPAAWWQEIRDHLRHETGRNVLFHAVLVDASRDNIRTISPVASAIGSWGGRTPEAAIDVHLSAQEVRNVGKLWIAPVAAQDVRPGAGLYAEAGNTETLRASWDAAIESRAAMVQLISWNDYSENTHLAPSRNNRGSWLQLLRILHSDKDAPRTRAEVMITYRTHAVAANARMASRNMSATLGGASTPPRDEIEVLTFLPTTERVSISVGSGSSSFSAPAGLSTHRVKLQPGRITVSLPDMSHSCKLHASDDIIAKPSVQDLSYHADWIQCP